MVTTGKASPTDRRSEHLRVHVHLLTEPCLWCWEIEDTAAGEVVESSWSSSWMAYKSAEEARAAGERRLAELAGRSPAAT
jgi:hypothetical protein